MTKVPDHTIKQHVTLIANQISLYVPDIRVFPISWANQAWANHTDNQNTKNNNGMKHKYLGIKNFSK